MCFKKWFKNKWHTISAFVGCVIINEPVIQLVASPTILSELLVFYLSCWRDLHHYRWLKNWSFSRTVTRLTVQFYFLFFRRNSPQWATVSSFTRFLDHAQQRTTVGRTPLDEWSARRRDLSLKTHKIHNRYPCPRWDSNPQPHQASDRRPTP